MNFEEAKNYTEKIYSSILSKQAFEENGEEHASILEICKKTRVEFKKCTCKFEDRFKDTVFSLMSFFKKNKDFPTTKYDVTRGVVFVVDGVAYTHTNMTDSIAERLLKEREIAKKYIKLTETNDVDEPLSFQLKTKKRKK